MTQNYSFRRREKPALYRMILPFGILGTLLFLSGCQTEQERRLAEAREMARQQTETQQKPTSPDTMSSPDSNPLQTTSRSSDSTTLPVSGDPTAKSMDTTPKSDGAISLPVYPGAVSLGADGNSVPGSDNGISTALLQTQAHLEEVVAFYKEQMKYEERLSEGNETRMVEPYKSESLQDGKRKIVLRRPRKDGGLQTVEVREGEGNTLIELMEVKGGKIGNPMSFPSGATPSGHTPTGRPTDIRGPLDQFPIDTSLPAKSGERPRTP